MASVKRARKLQMFLSVRTFQGPGGKTKTQTHV